jgi:hypothetical protein
VPDIVSAAAVALGMGPFRAVVLKATARNRAKAGCPQNTTWKRVAPPKGGLRRGYYRPGKERSGGWVRPVYSKIYTMALSGARGEKRASQEAWPKGLGHWDTPSIARKRPLVARRPPGSSRAQEPLSG